MGILVSFEYLNYKGETSARTIEADALEFIRNPGFGYQPGWFLSGLDVEKNLRRSFSLSHIVLPEGLKVYQLLKVGKNVE